MEFAEKQKQQVFDILLTPIDCREEYEAIDKADGYILTPQKYKTKDEYGNPQQNFDPDMSDFAIGFYEILYEGILSNDGMLKEDGRLQNTYFAGDTMNSFSTVTNRVHKSNPASDTKELLKKFENQYHCLANFWVLPLWIGRFLDTPFCKCSDSCRDYMDRYLHFLKNNWEQTKETIEVNNWKYWYWIYFNRFNNFEDFCNKHFLNANKNGYVNSQYQVLSYSQGNDANPQQIIQAMLAKIEARAWIIAKSDKCDALWEYFHKLNLA